MGAKRASATAVGAVAGVVLVVSLLVTWAASMGPDRVLAGDGPARHPLTPSESSASPSQTGGFKSLREIAPPPREAHPVRDAIFTAFAWICIALLVAGLAWLLVRLGRHAWERWQQRRRPPPVDDEVDFDPLTAPRRVADEIARDATTQRHVLEQGSTRNAIVACWSRFEEQAAEAGVRRRPWETSAEFTLRVLDLVEAEGSAVTQLAELFREARFSEHPLGEPHRAEALAALDAIHAGLGTLGAGPR